MARYCSIGGTVKFRVCVLIISLLGVSLMGCTSGEKRIKYSDDRLSSLSYSTETLEKIDMFAEDLCVIVDREAAMNDTSIQGAIALFDLSNYEVIYEKNAMKRLYPASTTKVMTALLTLKYADLDQEIVVGDEVLITEPGSSMAHVNPGDKITVRDLLYGLMLPSGNDVAATLATAVSGDIESFAELMTEEAKKLGATDTNFKNPHGLHDENHYTTAYDLYLIFQEALTYSEFKTVISTSSYEAIYENEQGEVVSQTWRNSNRYLSGDYQAPEGVIVVGGKTGTTSAAGNCLILNSTNQEGENFVSVVLKSSNRSELYQNMNLALDFIMK